MTGLIYSANLGFNGSKHYDRPREWPHEDGVMATMATNSYPTKSEARWRSREHKILSPPELRDVKWLLWLDASLLPREPMTPHVEKWLEHHDVAIFKHPWRDCAYDETDECVKRKKLDPRIGHEVKAMLALQGLPKHWGLWSCGAIAWRPGCEELRASWWKWTQRTGFRDQIALPIALRETGTRDRLFTIEGDIYSFFDWVPHGR